MCLCLKKLGGLASTKRAFPESCLIFARYKSIEGEGSCDHIDGIRLIPFGFEKLKMKLKATARKKIKIKSTADTL